MKTFKITLVIDGFDCRTVIVTAENKASAEKQAVARCQSTMSTVKPVEVMEVVEVKTETPK